MATFTLSIDFRDDMGLTIETETLGALLDYFEADELRGRRDWLVDQLRATVAGAEHGQAVRTVMEGLPGATVILNEAPQPVSSAPQTAQVTQFAPIAATPPNGTPTVLRSRTAPADPWADDEFPGEAAVARDALTSYKPATDDPWGMGPEKPAEPQWPAAPAGSLRVEKDNFGNEWTLGRPEAPMCECEDKAAWVKAKSRAGRWYVQWRCAKGVGNDWKNKCAFSEFPD